MANLVLFQVVVPEETLQALAGLLGGEHNESEQRGPVPAAASNPVHGETVATYFARMQTPVPEGLMLDGEWDNLRNCWVPAGAAVQIPFCNNQ